MENALYIIINCAKIKNKNLHKNGDFMANTITLIFNIVCLAFLVFGLFWGLIRGAKKTLSRGLFLLLLTIVTLFVTAPLTKLLLQIPINFNINTDGVVTSETLTIVEYLSQEIEGLLGNDFVTKYPDFASAIVSIPLILINAIVYVVIFWILKIILYPLNALFTKCFFGTKKYKEVMGFASINDTEYPNSDKSIEPLMDIYNKTQSEESTQAGVFIKKDNEISQNPPTGISDKANALAVSQVDKPKTKKELRKEHKAEKNANKPRKHRLLGAGLGVLVGMLVLFNTMIPVFGIMDILKDGKTASLKNITEEETSLSSLSNGITDDIIKGYELSAIGRIAQYIGMEQLGLIAFDQVTSTKMDDKKIVLRKDVNSLVNTVSQADKLMGDYKSISDKGLDQITQEELDDLILGLDKLIKSSEDVVLVDALSSYIIPIAVEYIVYNEIQLSDNPVINKAIVDTLVSIAQENDIAIFEELSTIVDIAKYLSEQKLLYPIVSNNYNNILDVFNGLSDNFGETLANKLFNLKTVNTTIPNILDMGLTIMDELTSFGYEKGSVTSETAKSTFTSLFSSIARIGKSLSYDSSIYVTDNSLPAIGSLLDTFKSSGIFNTTTYNNLVDYTVNIIKSQTASLIPDNLKNSFNNHLLRNICEVTSWESEMETIYTAMQILRNPTCGILGKYIDDTTNRTGYNFQISVDEDTLINIGKALDVLENSVLLGSKATIEFDSLNYDNTTFISLFSSILTEANQQLFTGSTDTTLNKLGAVITSMTNNLIQSSHTQSTSSTFWQDEMTQISPLITETYRLLQSTEQLEITVALGTALDDSTHSIMLGNDTTLTLMHSLLDIVREELVGADYVIKNDGSTIDNIYLLLVATLNNLDTSKEDGVKTFDILKEQNNLGETSTGDGKFWEQEMDSIIALMNISNKADSITTIADAQTIAVDLDQVYESRIIPENNLNKIIADILLDFRTSDTTGISGTINNIIEDIASNISTEKFYTNNKRENFWQIEFGHFSDLNNLSNNINSDIFSSTTESSTLNTLGSNLDTIAFNLKETISDSTTTLSYDETQNSVLIKRSMINELISTAFDLAKTDDTSDESEIFNSLITKIQESISNINSSNKVIEWKRELSYIPTLIQLNSSETYTLANASEKVGKYIDLIGFNTLANGGFADIQYDSDGNIITANIYSYEEGDVTKYYNSTIITRDILKDIVGGLLNNFKVTAPSEGELTSEETIANELIENLKNFVNTEATSTTKYNSYQTAFSELNDVKTSMENLSRSITKGSIDNGTISGTDIDIMLSDFQNKIISGVLTTRKIALQIANKVNNLYTDIAGFSSTPAGTYLSGLISHYETNIGNTNTEPEEYSVTADGTYANPFATLKTLLSNTSE